MPNVYSLYLDLAKKIKNPNLTVDKKLKECSDFVNSQRPFDSSNAQEISSTYEIWGDILYENNKYDEALRCYRDQSSSISIKLQNPPLAPVSSNLTLSNAHYKIGKTLLKQDKFEEAKSNFISSWDLIDKAISFRADKNETIDNYNKRSDIFYSLIDIARKQNDPRTLIDLCTKYAEKLKIPGVSLPNRDNSIRPLESFSLTAIEYKCIFAIKVFEFLSRCNLKDNKKKEALENLNFILEKFNEFELFNSRFKYKPQIDETRNLILSPKIVTYICKKGALLCLETGDNNKFKEYILKGLEYCDKLTDQGLQNQYRQFLFENIDKINSISPVNSKQDLETTSKIHSQIFKSFKKDVDFDRTMQLFKSFDFAEPSIDNPELYKIFVDRQHHISQTYKKNIGENNEYNALFRSEYANLVKFGNSILSRSYEGNKNFSNKDKLEIINRIVDRAKTLRPNFYEDMDKFQRFSIEIKKVVAHEERMNLSHRNEINYVILGCSYVKNMEDSLQAVVEAGGAGAGGYGAGAYGAGAYGAGAYGAGAAGDGGIAGAGGYGSGGAQSGDGGSGACNIIRPLAQNPINQSLQPSPAQRSLQQQSLKITNSQGAFKIARSSSQVAMQSSQSPNLSALDILANIALSQHSVISNSPSLQPSASRASSAEPQQKRLRDS